LAVSGPGCRGPAPSSRKYAIDTTVSIH
jgi:hypothetical protein